MAKFIAPYKKLDIISLCAFKIYQVKSDLLAIIQKMSLGVLLNLRKVLFFLRRSFVNNIQFIFCDVSYNKEYFFAVGKVEFRDCKLRTAINRRKTRLKHIKCLEKPWMLNEKLLDEDVGQTPQIMSKL